MILLLLLITIFSGCRTEIGCFCKDAAYTTKKDKQLFAQPSKIPRFIQDRIEALVERYQFAAAGDKTYPDLRLISYRHGAEARRMRKGAQQAGGKPGATSDSLKRKMTFALVDQNRSYKIDFLYLYIEAIEMQKKRNFNLHFTSRSREEPGATESNFLKRYASADSGYAKGKKAPSLLADSAAEIFENHGLNQYHSAEFQHHICVHFSIFLNKVLREYQGISNYKVVNQVSPLGQLYHEGSGHCEGKKRLRTVLQSGDDLAGERESARKMNTQMPKGLPVQSYEPEEEEDFERNAEEEESDVEVPIFIKRVKDEPSRLNRFQETEVDPKTRDPAVSPAERKANKAPLKKPTKKPLSPLKTPEKQPIGASAKPNPQKPKKIDISLLKYKKPANIPSSIKKRQNVGGKITDSIVLARKRLNKQPTLPDDSDEPEEQEEPQEPTITKAANKKTIKLQKKVIFQPEDTQPVDNLLEDEPEEDLIADFKSFSKESENPLEIDEDFEQNDVSDDNEEPPLVIQKRFATTAKTDTQQALQLSTTASQQNIATLAGPALESHPLLLASEHKFGKLFLTEEEETLFLTRLRVVLKDVQRTVADILSDYEAVLKSGIFTDTSAARKVFFQSGQEEIDIYLLDHPGNRIFYDFNKPTFAQIVEFEEKSKFIFAMIDFIYEINESGKETRELLGFLDDFSFTVYTDLTIQIRPASRLKELLMLVLAYKPYKQVLAVESEQFVDKMRAYAKIDFFYSKERKRLIGKLISWQNTHLLKEEQRLQLVRNAVREYMLANGIPETEVKTVNERDLTQEMCKYPEII